MEIAGLWTRAFSPRIFWERQFFQLVPLPETPSGICLRVVGPVHAKMTCCHVKHPSKSRQIRGNLLVQRELDGRMLSHAGGY